MDTTIQRHTIVISAVNIRRGGTLTILRECLGYLSEYAKKSNSRIIALVHNCKDAYYSGIEYIEIPWSIKSWGHRLWCEYVTMHKISKNIGDIDLWLSLHDTSPRVISKIQAVYCHNSFPFFEWRLRDLYMNWRIVFFAIFSKWYYRINISANHKVIVQQHWMKDEFIRLFHLNPKKLMVAYPIKCSTKMQNLTQDQKDNYTFIYPTNPDVHKNIEMVCQASTILEKRCCKKNFRVIITISPDDNRYSKWIYKKWGTMKSIDFIGYRQYEDLKKDYENSDCMIFASRVESWGLPISEYSYTGKPMLLYDRPYAHETAADYAKATFFTDVFTLAYQMQKLIEGDETILQTVHYNGPHTNIDSWKALFGFFIS